jgi:ABC-type transport system substrate-binding protein
MPYDMYFSFYTFNSPDIEPTIYDFAHSGTVSNHGYKNAELDAALEQARIESDIAKRVPLYQKALGFVLDECPFIYTVHQVIVRPATAKLMGYVPAAKSTVIQLDSAWLAA